LCVGGLPAATAQEPREGLAAEVEARETAFAQTMADRDLEAFASFLSEEAIFISGPTTLRGSDQVKKGWAPYFTGPQAPFSWQPDTIEVLPSGTLALSSGPVHNPTGEVVGRFNSIWRRDADGVWRIVFDKGS
jgi:ketosteroid isomerase-like protein